jgi:hypothetical protein
VPAARRGRPQRRRQAQQRPASTARGRQWGEGRMCACVWGRERRSGGACTVSVAAIAARSPPCAAAAWPRGTQATQAMLGRATRWLRRRARLAWRAATCAFGRGERENGSSILEALRSMGRPGQRRMRRTLCVRTRRLLARGIV